MKHVTVRRSVFLFALVGLSACLATLGLPGTGSAGAGDPQSFTVTAVRTSTGQGGASPQAESSITCTISIDNPHKSTHVPTTVNVVSHWNCDAIVQKLTLDTKLYRGVQQVGSGHSEGTGTFVLNGNAAASCVNGQYLGEATGTSRIPPGLQPAIRQRGPSRQRCGADR